ncbi:MAG: YesL family protein [Clostridia bacterium]|nr:YesL family protein [Clostridia bacterium]
MKKSKWNLYNLLNRDVDKPDAEESKDVVKMNFKGFFILFFRKFNTLVWTNILFVVSNFPVFFGLTLFVGAINDLSLTPQHLSFSNIYGALAGKSADPLSSVWFAVSSSPIVENEFNKPLLILFIALTCLVLFTFGFSNVGSAYLMRSAIRRKPIFLVKDYFGAIRRNWKQGLLLGIFDLVFAAITVFDVMVFFRNYSYGFFYVIAFFFTLGVALIYLCARPYMYLLCITFDLPFFKLIKNSVIFAFLGFKRNILAIIGQAFMIYVIFLLISSGLLAALGVVLPIILYFGVAMFMSYYAAYKVVDKNMIEPYYDEDGNPIGEENKTLPDASE